MRVLWATIFILNNLSDFRVIHLRKVLLNIIICTLIVQLNKFFILNLSRFFVYVWLLVVTWLLLHNIRVVDLRSYLELYSLTLLIIRKLEFWLSLILLSVINSFMVPMLQLLNFLRRLVHFNFSLRHLYFYLFWTLLF